VAATILKNPKSRHLDNGLTNRHEIWHDDAVRPSWPFGLLQIWDLKKSKMAAAGILTIRNYDISAKVWPICRAFGTMMLIGPPNQACYSGKFVRQFLCVNFAYANSYVRNANQKTFLRTKNRKFVRKYTHDLSCQTTENFRKDSELMKLPWCLVLKSQQKFVYGDACNM